MKTNTIAQKLEVYYLCVQQPNKKKEVHKALVGRPGFS